MHNQDRIGKPSWTILNLLKWTSSYFSSHHVESPRASAEILLAHALGVNRIDLYIRYDQPVMNKELQHFKTLIKRRVGGEPVAYILGVKEFWSMTFSVTPDVLIPRPETECLVEAALTFMQQKPEIPMRVLDMGTGSGAIILALAKGKPGHQYTALDRSESAVKIARKNAMTHNLQEHVHFFCSDWFSAVKEAVRPFDLILTNPPYIRTRDIPELQPEIAGYEPASALDGGGDGLDAIRRILEETPRYLSPGGCLLMEIGYDQKPDVESYASHLRVYTAISFIKDYSGRHRIFQGKIP